MLFGVGWTSSTLRNVGKMCMKAHRQLVNATATPLRITTASGSLVLPIYAGMEFTEMYKDRMLVIDGMRVPVHDMINPAYLPEPEGKTVFIVPYSTLLHSSNRADLAAVSKISGNTILDTIVRRGFWFTGKGAMRGV